MLLTVYPVAGQQVAFFRSDVPMETLAPFYRVYAYVRVIATQPPPLVLQGIDLLLLL